MGIRTQSHTDPDEESDRNAIALFVYGDHPAFEESCHLANLPGGQSRAFADAVEDRLTSDTDAEATAVVIPISDANAYPAYERVTTDSDVKTEIRDLRNEFDRGRRSLQH